MNKGLITVALLGAVWFYFNYNPSVSLGPGVMAPNAPQQSKIYSAHPFAFGDYHITEVASFDIEAKVLAKENYYSGRESELSPTDLALGWGNMSDEAVLANIDISQSGRFYRWRVEEFPIPRQEIETSSANMHLIPADDTVKRRIDRIREGDIVEISGSLVNVTADGGKWYWKSSQTRNDTGKGACELIYVKWIDVISP